MKVEVIADYACNTGEGPLYHRLERRVYWTDIPAGRLFRYDPATGEHEQVYAGEPVGGFTIQADGSLLLFMARGAIRTWSDGDMETIVDSIPEELDSRFNDVIADPAGRVFCGTMSSPDHPGSLYRLDVDGTLSRVVEGVGVSNGMGFTPDRKGMYYTDSASREISLFDYDEPTGAITNRRSFLTLPSGNGVPDGMTVDAEGFLWAAFWDGGCIRRFSPLGEETLRIEIPTPKVSCVSFGGEDYADLYVTTAGGDDKGRNGSGAGALYRVRVSEGGETLRGVPEFVSRVAAARG